MSMEDAIEVRITAQAGALQTGLQQARDAVAHATQKMRDSFGTMRDETRNAMKDMSGEIGGEVEKMAGSFGKLLNVIPGIKAAFLGLGAALLLREAVDETAKETEETMKLARALGITTNEATSLRMALGDVHASAGEYEAAAKGMSRQLLANEADMNKLGLSTRDAQGHLKPMNELMLEGIEVLKGYKAGADQNIAAQVLFGRGIDASSNLLLMNKETVTEANDAMKKYGLEVGGYSTQAWKEYRDASNEAGDAVEGMRKAIGDSLMPVVNTALNAFSSTMPAAITVVRYALATLTTAFLVVKDSVEVVVNVINAMVVTVAEPIRALGSAIYKALTGHFSEAADELKGIGSKIADSWAGSTARIQAMTLQTREQIKQMFSADTSAGQGGPPNGTGTVPDGLRHHGSKGAGSAAAEKSQMSIFQNALEAEKAGYAEMDALHGMSKQAELDFWNGILSTATLSESDKLAVAKQASAARVAVLQQEAQQAKQLQGIDLASWQNAELAKVTDAENAAKLRKDLHQETDQHLLQQEIDFENQRQQIRLAALRATQATLDPDRDPIQYAQISAKIEALEQAHQQKLANIRGQIALQSAKEQGAIWQTLNNTVGKLWDSGIQALMNGTLTWRNAMRAIGAEVVGIFAEIVKKKVITWLAGEEAQTGATVLGTAERGAAETAASVKSVALWAATAVKNIMASAWEAMAGAWKAMVGIPYVGPVLAVAAAGAAFAGVSALASNVASAEGGYDIPAGVNPMTQLHEREMVLPRAQADAVRNMAEGGGGGGGGTHHWHIHAVDGADAKRFLMDNHGSVAKAMEKAVRNFAFNPRSLR